MSDPSTQANIKQVITEHIHLNWSVDFSKHILKGNVMLDLKTLVDNVDRVVLDTSYLDIQSISLDGHLMEFTLEKRYASLGSALTVHISLIPNTGTRFKLLIDYETTTESTAIQFLKPEQTVGGQHPYLFSQCQPIHSRSLLPCQDTPSVKITYSAFVTSPLPVVMSAIHTSTDEGNDKLQIYRFEQPIPIPTYLIAIAVGNLVKRDIGPRSAVWCEPQMIEAAAWEFEQKQEVESFIRTGEALLTPYKWGRYDLLVLPPSFPYGGMENPCLTFVTPTLLAGDRSATNVIAHEIAHSWTGNLVTNNSWEHFWLNEGWTVFVERKIIGRLNGEKARQFSALSGWKTLKESVDLVGEHSHKTLLNPDLSNGADPDDFFSRVPYEKGFNLLYHIEKVVGGPDIFEPFMKAYIEKFACQSISTDNWKQFLFDYMEKKHGTSMLEKVRSVNYDIWIHHPGMPPVDPEFDTTLADASLKLGHRWEEAIKNENFSSFSADDMKDFTAGQKVLFLETILDHKPFSHPSLHEMNKLYNITNNHNPEIRLRWQLLCLKADYEPIYSEVVRFVTEQGRMKYVRPLYRSLHLAKKGAQLAVDTYLQHKVFYHPIAAQLIEKDIGLAQKI
ncbi:peptidase family M1-domain-containing protein [Pilobolus umbonatus]|nr:peptidase family M1-domain-containing protein [Pilobolus umbonatus]